MAYALEHNLETLAAAQEKAVNDELATGAVYRLLPSLLLDTEQSWKSREIPSYSESFEERSESLEPSISSDLHTNIFNTTLSWDLLNLAVNVYKWRQAEKRSGSAEERLRRVRQDVVLNVTEAFMRAAVAKEAAERAASLIAKAEKRGEVLRREIRDDLVPVIDGLQNEIDVMEMRLRFESYEDNRKAAMAKLRELLGVPQETGIPLAEVDFNVPPPTLAQAPERFEREAVQNRPELYERDFEEQISLDEADAAMARMFPSVTPFTRFTHDANSFLLRHTWFTTGLKLSWDLLSIPSTYHDKRAAVRQAELERRRRLMLTLSVMTQVRLAVIEYRDALEKLPLTRRLADKREQLMEIVEEHAETGRLHESLLLDEDQNYLSASLMHLNTYADVVVAEARINNARGLDWEDGAYKDRTADSEGVRINPPGKAVADDKPSVRSAEAAESSATTAEEATGDIYAPKDMQSGAPAFGLSLMTVNEAVNIRGMPGEDQRIVGRLHSGMKVKAGFLSNGWYAVFAPESGDVIEADALGYVHAPLLVPAEPGA